MTIALSWIGIDISKAWLDIADPACRACWRLANQPGAVADFAAALKGRNVIVVFEATGVYDTCLRHALDTAGIAHVRVNPQRARDFARACGRLAKTDRLDAAMLAEMGSALRLEADPPCNQSLETLALLNKRRDQLVAMRQQERVRQVDMSDAEISAGLDDHIVWLSHAIATVETAIVALVKASQPLAEAAMLMRSMPGVGPVTATTLIALMPELGQRSHKAIAMLAGLAPVNADSGQRRGQRTIRGGRRRVRQALYMAAVATLRNGSPLLAFYKRLRETGKPAKLALVALARKMLVTLNAMVRSGTPFRS